MRVNFLRYTFTKQRTISLYIHLNVDATLRRSTRVRKSAIPSDYIAYLQESDYNIEAENDPKTFDQAMSCKESNLWYDAMKDEMNSM